MNGNATVDAGSDVDFGDREFRIKAGKVVTIGPGPIPRVVKFTAERIVLEPGAKILGNGDGAEIILESTVGSIELQSAGSNRSEIDVSADTVEGGDILLDAATDALLHGFLFAKAHGEDARGGSIAVNAGGIIETTHEINASGLGSFAGGGRVTITGGGDVSLLAKVSTEGSDFGGGDVTIASIDGEVTLGALIQLSGGNPDGEAGELDVDAGTDITLTAAAEIRGRGGAGPDEECGDGALVFLTAGGTTDIGGEVNVNGGFRCFGGDLDVETGLDFTQGAASVISTASAGNFGAAGGVFLRAGRRATLRSIDGSSDGFGADIQVVAPVSIDVLRKVTARATGPDGVGGRIELIACAINVLSPDGELDTRGNFAFAGFGENVLEASGPMTISGDLSAASHNRLFYKTVPPLVSGAAEPPATIVQDLGLADCATTCGDGNTSPPEECDDANLISCDGCSSACRIEQCGNATLECSEQCDDGDRNGTADSRCSDACAREPRPFRLRGSGSRLDDCMMQWSLEMDEANVAKDKNGNPRAAQSCTAGDPTCDLGAAAGCQMDLWACFGSDNPAIGCSAASVGSADVRRPRVDARTPWELDARAAMVTALAATPFPVGPGEVCTESFRVEVPSGEALRLGARAYGVKKEADNLEISCQ